MTDQRFNEWVAMNVRKEEVPGEIVDLFFKKGYLALDYFVYDLEKYDLDQYMNDRDFVLLHPINGWMGKLIDDKRFIPLLYKSTPQYLPDLSISIEDRRVRYILERGVYQDTTGSLESILRHYVAKYGQLFLKPAGLKGGNGTFPADITQLAQLLETVDSKHAYLINERVANAPYSEQIHPGGINTIRAYIFKPVGGSIRLFRAFHRFGTRKSSHVDNITAGGLACEIDLQTGRLSPSYSIFKDFLNIEYHPDSGIRLAGFQVPDWPGKLDQINDIISVVPFLEWGALDLAVTPDGLKLLEINSLPSRRLLQMNRPAFLDEEFREFCYSKGYGKVV
jgi:hypothetical protein